MEEPFKFLKQTCNRNHGGADHEAVQSVGKARKALKEQDVTREQVSHSATSGKLFVVALVLLGVLGCAGWWVASGIYWMYSISFFSTWKGLLWKVMCLDRLDLFNLFLCVFKHAFILSPPRLSPSFSWLPIQQMQRLMPLPPLPRCRNVTCEDKLIPSQDFVSVSCRMLQMKTEV